MDDDLAKREAPERRRLGGGRAGRARSPPSPRRARRSRATHAIDWKPGKLRRKEPSRPYVRVWADSVVRLDERVRARRARARAGTALEDEPRGARVRGGVSRAPRRRRQPSGATSPPCSAPFESCATQTVVASSRPRRSRGGRGSRRRARRRRARRSRARRLRRAPRRAGQPPKPPRTKALAAKRRAPRLRLRLRFARNKGSHVVDGNVAEMRRVRRFRSVSETPGAPYEVVGPSRIRERRGSDQRRPVLERPRLDRARARFVFRVCRPAVGSFAAVHADGSARGTPRRRTLADHGRRRERVASPSRESS